jgi:DNA helicase-2/ATP-dependent DNA helicase PcrA
LNQFDETVPEEAERVENVRELLSVANQFPNLHQFLENVTLTEKESKKNIAHDQAVTLMTLHSAKGLEFDTVFLVGLEEGLFPHSRALADSTAMEEERRLCYVGITRAKSKLHLTYARQRLYFGQRNSNVLSRFISEIPEKLLDFESNQWNSW